MVSDGQASRGIFGVGKVVWCESDINPWWFWSLCLHEAIPLARWLGQSVPKHLHGRARSRTMTLLGVDPGHSAGYETALWSDPSRSFSVCDCLHRTRSAGGLRGLMDSFPKRYGG